MKKLYMPTENELYIMQDLGINIYQYIMAKAIESLVLEAKVHSHKNGILKYAYKYLKESPEYLELVRAICMMYPEEIKYSELAQNDTQLCLSLITKKGKNFLSGDSSICELDHLAHFESGVGVLSNKQVVETTIQTLSEKLPTSPEYRFEYQSSSLLDSIFSGTAKTDNLSLETIEQLVTIEPGYALELPNETIISLEEKHYPHLKESKYFESMLQSNVRNYTRRYGISSSTGEEYQGKDILGNKEPKVKRLLKCIDEHKI